MDGQLSRRTVLGTALAIGAASAWPGSGVAQTDPAAAWPDRLITTIVPVAAGGIIDVLARAVGDAVKARFGTPAIAESRPGADHMIGTRAVARAEPDGYTWLFASVPFTVSPALHKDAGYDPLKDFAPLQLIATSPNILVVSSSVEAKTAKEFVDLAKAKPGELNYANPGNGSSNHLGMELLKQVSGTDLLGVIYKGQPPAVTDLIAGRINAMMIGSTLAIPHIQSGALRPLAVVAKERLRSMPDVPTMAEAGYPDVDLVPWFGLLAPAQTSKAILDKASGALHDALKTEDLLLKIERIGALAYPPNSPEEFARQISDDAARWPALLAKAGLKQI